MLISFVILCPQVASIGVIFEEDDQFGDVDCHPGAGHVKSVGPGDRFDALDLSHLTAARQQQL